MTLVPELGLQWKAQMAVLDQGFREEASSEAYEQLVPGRKSTPRAIPASLKDSLNAMTQKIHFGKTIVAIVYNVKESLLTPSRYERIR